MSEELISQYVDRAAIADDTKFLTDQLKTVLDLFEKVNATKVSLSGAKTMSEVAEGAKVAKVAVDNLSAGKEKLLKVDLETVKAGKDIIAANGEIARSNKVVADSYDKVVKALVENEVESNKLKQQRRSLNEQLAEGLITIEEYKKKLEAIRKEESSLSVSNQDLNRALKNFEKEAQAAAGSTNELRAQLNQALQAYDGLSAADKNSDIGAKLKANIDSLNQSITEAEQSTGRFQRNVGNYNGAARIIVEALEKARQKFDQLSKAADASPAALNQARREMEALRSVTDNKQFLSFAGGVGDATKEVRTFTKTLVNLESQGLGNSDVAKDLRKRLAELTDQIGDTRAEIKALSSDSRTFDLFASSVNFAVDVFQTATGAMIAFGASEQDAAEATKTLLALQNISNGVRGIANELTTKGTAANKAFAFAQGQLATAFDASATAGARFRAVLFSLGIGAIIAGIGLLIANFDKIKRAVTGVSKAQEAYNKVLAESSSEFTSAVKLVNELKTNIDLARKGFIEKEKVIKQYNDSLGKTTGQVKSLDEAEKALIEKGEAYIQMTLAKAVANLALEEAAKKAFEAEQKRRKDAEEFIKVQDKLTQISTRSASASPGGFIPSNNNLQKEEELRKSQGEKRKKAAIKQSEDEEKVFIDIANKAQQKAAELSKKFNLNFFGDSQSVQQKARTEKFYDGELKAEADAYKKLSENLDAYVSTRLSAREKAFEAEKAILNGQRAIEIRNLNGELSIEKQRASIGEISKEELAQKEREFADKRADINRETAEKIKDLERSLGNDIVNIRASFIVRQREQDQEANDQFFQDQEDAFNKQVDQLQDIQEDRFKEQAEGREAEIKDLDKWYQERVRATREGSKAREKVDQDYAIRRADIEYSYGLAALRTQIEFAEKLIAVRKGAGEDITQQEKELAELRIELSDLETKRVLDNNKKQGKSHQEKLEAIEAGITKTQEIFGQVTGIIDGFISASTDKQKNAIQEQLDDLDKKKEKEIEAVNSALLTEQEKANKIAIINARSAAQKDALERRQRQLDLQRARFEKAANIAQAIIRTAVAVIEGLIKFGPAGAITYGAIGAAQIAAAIAAPLPKFKHGREGGPATWAITGDGGVPEVATSPDLKQAYVTPATDTLTYLPKDWKVFPDVDAFQEAAMNLSLKPLPVLPVINNNNDGLIRAMAYEIGSLKSAILGKQETHFHWHNGELKKAIKNGNDWWRYTQNNV